MMPAAPIALVRPSTRVTNGDIIAPMIAPTPAAARTTTETALVDAHVLEREQDQDAGDHRVEGPEVAVQTISLRSSRWWANQRRPSTMSSRTDVLLTARTGRNCPTTVRASSAASNQAVPLTHSGIASATANSHAPMGAPRKMLPTLSAVLSRLLPRSSCAALTTPGSIARAALS